ncbi:restriction endonuclease [Amycolatopsis sp. GA6-003]|uniref:restriction endonuclease n=1 Tax=Amycolatopsis sp. GA6-003 TaxID=2652444 RepID=UPI003916F1C0
MLDFAELSADGEDLELLVRELCRSLGYVVRWSGRGQDAGRDLLLEERGDPLFGRKIRRWLVSCKHTARANGGAGRSVSSNDVGELGGVVDAVTQHGASGFLLVCSTQPSSALVTRFEAIERDKGVPIHIWDGADLERMLDTPRGWSLAQRFMPQSAETAGWRVFATASPNQFVGVTRGFFYPPHQSSGKHKLLPAQLDR